MSAMDGHDMQPHSDSHQPHTSAEERIAEQAREIQELRVSNWKAYVRLRAGKVGKVPRPAELKDIVVLYKAGWLVHNDS